MYEQLVLSIIDVIFNNITSLSIGAFSTLVLFLVWIKR